MKHVIKKLLTVSVLLFAPLSSHADVVDTDYIFSDRYIGALVLPWVDGANHFDLYSRPLLQTKHATKQAVQMGCLFGGGGDCLGGTLYKRMETDKSGNRFLLVKDLSDKDVWIIAASDAEIRPLDIVPGTGGTEVVLSKTATEDFAHQGDAAPNLTREREVSLRTMLQKIAPDLAIVSLQKPLNRSQGDKLVTLWPSNADKSEALQMTIAEFWQKLVSGSLQGEQEHKTTVQLNLLHKKGNQLLVSTEVPFPFASRISRCAMDDTWFFWLDAQHVDFTMAQHLIEDTAEARLGVLMGILSGYDSVVVDEVKQYAKNDYAKLIQVIEIFDPSAPNEMNQTYLPTKVFRLPLSWQRIRDEQGHLRFWFQDVSC